MKFYSTLFIITHLTSQRSLKTNTFGTKTIHIFCFFCFGSSLSVLGYVSIKNDTILFAIALSFMDTNTLLWSKMGSRVRKAVGVICAAIVDALFPSNALWFVLVSGADSAFLGVGTKTYVYHWKM